MRVDNDVRKYLRQIKVLLPLYRRPEKEFLKELTISIESYTDEHKDADIEELERTFGTPMEIAQSYVNSTDPEIIISRLSLSRILRNLLISFLVAMTIGLCVTTAFTYKAYLDSRDTVITEKETIIEDD